MKFSKSRGSNPQVIQILGVVASAYGQLGDIRKAVEIQRRVVKTAAEHLGEEHKLTIAMRPKLKQLESQL